MEVVKILGPLWLLAPGSCSVHTITFAVPVDSILQHHNLLSPWLRDQQPGHPVLRVKLRRRLLPHEPVPQPPGVPDHRAPARNPRNERRLPPPQMRMRGRTSCFSLVMGKDSI